MNKLADFTDGKITTAQSQAEVKANRHPELKSFIHTHYPTILEFDFSVTPTLDC